MKKKVKMSKVMIELPSEDLKAFTDFAEAQGMTPSQLMKELIQFVGRAPLEEDPNYIS